MRVKCSGGHAHTYTQSFITLTESVTQPHIPSLARWHLILVAGLNWSRFTCLTVYQWRIIPELTAEGKTHSGNPLNVQTCRSESSSDERRTHNSFNGITGNSVPPQCFNVLLDTLTHRGLSLQEEMKNQYILPIGLSKEAGRERPQRQTPAGAYKYITKLICMWFHHYVLICLSVTSRRVCKIQLVFE